MADDDTIRLALQIDDTDVPRAKANVAALDATTRNLGQTVQVTTRDVYDFADVYELVEEEQRKVVGGMEAVITATKTTTITTAALTQEEKKLAASMEAMAAHARTAETATMAFGKAGMNMNVIAGQASYAIGDFMQTSGDMGQRLMSISNNVQFAAAQFGPWGMAAGIGVTMVASLVRNWDDLMRAFKEKTALPQAADSLHRLNDELENTEKRLEALQKSESLTLKEAKEYTKLLERRVELEKETTKEKERQADLKKLEALPNAAEADSGKERSEALQDMLGGRQDEMTNELAQAMRQAAKLRFKELIQRVSTETDPAKIRQIQNELATVEPLTKSTDANMGYAKDMMAKAIIKGSLEDFKTIRAYMRQSPDVFLRYFQQAFELASPEALQADRDFEGAIQNRQDQVKARTSNKEQQKHNAAKAKERYQQMIKELDDQDRKAKEAEHLKDQANADRRKVEVPGITRAYDKETAAIKSGGYVEMAERLMAKVRAEGGAEDAAGRFHKMDADQQFEYVKNQVAQYLHRVVGQDKFGRDVRANAGMGHQETGDVSTRIAAMANMDISKKMTAMSGQGLTQQAQLIMIANAALDQIRTLQEQQRQQQVAIGHLAVKARANTRRGN